MPDPISTTTAGEQLDVVVVGAGPAGAAAAVELARAGCTVALVDRATFPRDKCCGDGLTTLALRELEALGLDPAAVAGWREVDAAWLRSPSGREVCVPLPAGAGVFAATAPRRHLDAALVDIAVREGARLRCGHAVTAIDQQPEQVVVTLDDGRRLRARYAIAADGMWSPVRKLLGLAEPGYLGEWHAFRQYARNVTGPARDRLYVWFEGDLLPGYAWSFPLPDGRVNIGFGVQRPATGGGTHGPDGRRTGKELKALWPELLARPHIAAALGPEVELEDRHTAWPIPAAVDRATLTAGRVLFVGDAARATDVMTGEGIGQALLTGRLAAEAVLAGGTAAPDVVRTRYEADVRHHLLADHRMSKALSRALASERGARGAIRLVGASGSWGRRNFARWMFEDEPRALLVTPSRWHRRILRRDGPFAHP